MDLPSTAIDCHCHVLAANHPPVPGAKYEPFDASYDDYIHHLAELGIGRGVLVTPSAYGTDNEPVTQALGISDRGLRGIAVIDPQTVTDRDFEALRVVGVCGVRLQDRFPGGVPLEALSLLGDRLAELNWHIEVWTDFTEHLDWLPGAIRHCRVPVVIDHLGYFPETTPSKNRAIEAMIELSKSGDAWVTLSGAYRLNPGEAPDAAGVKIAPRVHRLLDAIPGRLLWGSDWPYAAAPHGAPAHTDILAELNTWFVGDQELLERVTVANNVACYGFSGT